MTEEFSQHHSIYRAFESLVTEAEEAIDTARVALLIATITYPLLDAEYYIAQLDALAYRVRGVLGLSLYNTHNTLENTAPLTIIDAINTILFEEEGFHGNTKDYGDPNNSFLNKVLDERVGIPISLSLLYMEVAKRVGLPIEGVGLPFHFVVRCVLPTEILYIDPFEHGLLLSEQDCRERIRRLSRGKITRLPQHFFEPVKPKQLLVRMLGNLKNAYLDKEDYKKSLVVANCILLLIPDAARELRDRGTIHLQLQHYARALHDLKTYLKLEAQASDRHEIQGRIQMIQHTISMMN